MEDQYSEYRCGACGCFLGTIDTSTESGYDFELVCNNPRCKSKIATQEDLDSREA